MLHCWRGYLTDCASGVTIEGLSIDTMQIREKLALVGVSIMRTVFDRVTR
jgi:hypothetical protein